MLSLLLAFPFGANSWVSTAATTPSFIGLRPHLEIFYSAPYSSGGCGTVCNPKQQRQIGLAAIVNGDVPNDPKVRIDHMASSRAKPRQFWLDLRGTAIRPDEALLFLQKLITDDDNIDEISDTEDGKTAASNHEQETSHLIQDLVDRILITESTFADLLQNPKITEDTKELVYVTDNTGELIEDLGGSLQQSMRKGTVLSCCFSAKGDVYLDPTMILETNSEGDDNCNEWILVDCNNAEIRNIEQYTEQVQGLLQIMQAVRCTNKQDISFVMTTSSSSSSRGKCLAVTCPNRDLLVSVDRCLTTQTLAADQSTAQTDSGILYVPSATIEIAQQQQNRPSSNFQPGGKHGDMVVTAIVLPFDLRLWKTAMELV